MAGSLQQFIPLLATPNIKKRIQLGSDILSCLQSPSCLQECDEIGYFIDSVSSWLSNSNFKVAQNGIEIMTILAEEMKEDFKPYISTIFPAIVDRLGDGKDQVRLQAKGLMLKLMDPVSSPQHIFDKMTIAFNHKNFRVREEVMTLLQQTLDKFGSSSLIISRLMPSLVKLLSDPNVQVREAAISTMVHVYRHVGERLRHDLTKRAGIPAPKLQLLITRFDEVKNSGTLLPSATEKISTRSETETDSKSQHSESSEADGATITKSASKRASSAPPSRRGAFKSCKSLPSTTSSSAGGADEDMFIKSFEDVPRLTLYSSKDLESELSKVKDVLANPNNDWEKRVEMCKRLRSVVIAGGHEYDEFFPFLRQLELPFQNCVKDLRSQVVREACITIAFLSQQLGSKLDHFAESLLPCLINLIPNCAKIMSTAGIVAIHFIIRYTHVSRLIPIVTTSLYSKSKDIRKTCFEFLDQLLVTWPTHTLEKHVGILIDAIRKGISDADPEARAFSRKAFWGFADHFRDQADVLLNSLDNTKQRKLHEELTMSNSSSSSSLTQSGKPYRSNASNRAGSAENLSIGRTGTFNRRTGFTNTCKSDASSGIPTRLRSTSAIDLSAVRRAKARASYSTIANLTKGSGASLPRRKDSPVHAITSPERVLKSLPRGSSQSQPSSRPDSPSSRLSYAIYSSPDSGKPNRARSKSGIPIATSREASPTRTGFVHERRLSGSRIRLGAGEKYPSLPSSVAPLMAERTLQQSREAEVAVADALRSAPRRRYNAFDEQSDESETSSVCSDRSFSSFGRNVDYMNEVIHNLQSMHWLDRKDGLQALQAYFRSGRMLSNVELKKVTDIFSKIFMDPHTKVFSLFLDTLNELIVIHKNDLYAWLYVLMARLFMKMGADILGSVLAKIQKTLDLVRESFPFENQFTCIVRFLNDLTQTPNSKVKMALLNYLSTLIPQMDPYTFISEDEEIQSAFMKVISWTAMPKCGDLKKGVAQVLLALFTLNPAECSSFISGLQKPYKDVAFQLIQSEYPRSVPDSQRTLSSVMSPNSMPWPKSQGGTPQNCSFDLDDTENLNPEEIMNSWKKTVSEIEEYDFKVSDKLIQDFPPQLIQSRHSSIDGRFDSPELNSSGDCSPTKKSPSNCNNIKFSRNEGELADNPEFDTEMEGDQKDIFSIIDELNQSARNENKIAALCRLACLVKAQSSIISQEHFRIILREVIEAVEDTTLRIRVNALNALYELLISKADYFQDYIELTLLKIINAHKDTDFEMMFAAEKCLSVASTHLPPEPCVRTLKALIFTEEVAVSQAAIKMLTKIVENHSKQTVLNILPEVMPALVKSSGHNQSIVRKEAIYSMVAIHLVVGDAMQPYISNLHKTRLKLLNVYIQRAEEKRENNSSCASNDPSSSNQ